MPCFGVMIANRQQGYERRAHQRPFLTNVWNFRHRIVQSWEVFSKFLAAMTVEAWLGSAEAVGARISEDGRSLAAGDGEDHSWFGLKIVRKRTILNQQKSDRNCETVKGYVRTVLKTKLRDSIYNISVQEGQTKAVWSPRYNDYYRAAPLIIIV